MNSTTPPNSASKAAPLAHPLESLLKRLLHTARRIQPQRPEDLAHDTLVRLLAAEAKGGLPPFKSEHQLFAYARQTMRNLAASTHRCGATRGEYVIEDEAQLAGESTAIIGPPSAAESKLPTRARLSIVLRNRLGCSHEVIAKLLGHPNQAASQSYHSRSLRTLRESVEPSRAAV